MNIPNTWTFKTNEVSKNFDSHVREQLPWYDLVQDFMAYIALSFLHENSIVYDIGASTGNFSKRILNEIKERNVKWIPIDDSEQMKNFYSGAGTLVNFNAMDFEYKNFDLAVLFLAFMFLPVNGRNSWLKKLYEKLNPGGAIIIVDKLKPKGGLLSTSIHRYLMKSKINQGATAENVLKKELSLQGIQNPLDRNFLNTFPNAAEVFRFGDFVGYVIEKKEN